MSQKLQERLKEIAKECGGNRALCEKSGVSERTFANWLAGSSEPKIIGIAAIASAAGVTIDWIVTGSKPKQHLGSRQGNTSEMVKVPLIDASLQKIEAPTLQRLKVNDHIPFSTGFLENRLKQNDFDQLCVLEIHGDSMEPTMGNSDIVLVDRSNRKVSDGLMAYIFKETIYVKRIVNLLNGIEVISDNQSLYSSHNIAGNDLKNLEIFGHVLWVGKTVL